MSKYGDDIRRISRYQELLDLIRQNKLTEQDKKDVIDGQRGIAYAAVNGATSAITGTPGVTKPDNDGITPPVDKPRVDVPDDGDSNNDNDSVGDSDLSDSDNTDRDGWYDADSLLSGDKDEYGKYPPKPGDGLNINSLTGLSDSTRPIITHLKEAANAFIGPNDRDDANQFVADPAYTPGFFYRVNNAGGSNFEDVPTPAAAITSGTNYLDGVLTPDRLPVSFVGWFTTGGSASTPPDTVGVPKNMRFEDALGNLINDSVNYLACTITSSIYACPIVSVGVAWADLGATQMAWTTEVSARVDPFEYNMAGKFNPHPYDGNVPTSLQNGTSSLDLTTNQSNTVRIGPLGSDGWYAAYTDSLGGSIAGDANSATVLKINADRSHGGFITPNALAKILPPST